MERLLLLFARSPWLWLAGILLLSVLAATQLEKVEIRISADEMLVDDDPERAFSELVASTFGEPQITLVVVEGPSPFTPDQLDALNRVVDELARLPFVSETHSLFNTPHVKSVEGYLDKAPYLDPIPDNESDTQALLERARDNPLLRNILVAAEAEAMAIALVIDEATQADDDEVTTSIDQVIAALDDGFLQAYAIGFTQIRSELAQRIAAEQWALAPLAVAALLIVLFLLLRQLVDILVPLFTAGISVLWTLGFMGWLGIPLNVVTSMVPILLIVVGSTEDVHLLAEFRHAQVSGDDRRQALKHMAVRMGRTVLLTFVTTFAGFLSVGLSGIKLLEQFGSVASAGLLFNFVITIVLIPSVLALAGHWRLDGRSRLFDPGAPKRGSSFWPTIKRHRRRILIGLGIIAVVAASGIPRIQVEHNPINSLGDDSPTASDIARFNARFAGLESFAIVLESGIQDTFLHSRYLDEVIETQQFLRALDPSFSVTSLVDYLTTLNRAFLEDERAGPPRSNDEISELMLFLDFDRIGAYATEDFSRVRIQIRHQINDSERLRAIFSSIEQHLDENLDPGLRARLTGDSVLSLAATDSMIRGQLQSVLLIVLLFIGIVALIFTDVRVGLLAAIPNLFPVVVLFGTMGYVGIPLNIGTTMAAAIAIGIAVDDTLHFMLRYNQELRRSHNQDLAMQSTLRQEALPVIGTSASLTAGFLVFAMSGFEPVSQFGILSALVIITALFADFVVTPVILASLRLVTLWELLSPKVRDQVIPQSPLFAGMRPWQIRRFVLSSSLIDFRAGDQVFRQGDDSDSLYLIMQGRVEVQVHTDQEDVKAPVINRFETGEVFGDVALLAEEARRTNATALEHTTLMVLTREGIRSVTVLHPYIAARLFYNLARNISCRWVAFVERIRGRSEKAPKNER